MTIKRFATPKFWLTVALSLALTMMLAIVFRHFQLQTLLQNALLWVRDLGNIGIIAFMLIYNLATILFIPGSLLTLGGGVLYGAFWGSLYVMIAATLGAAITFLIGRYCARNWVLQKIQKYPKFQMLDRAVARGGVTVVLLTRLSPVFPFSLLNYMFGVTSISFKDYVTGSMGMVPGTVLYVYIGSLVGDIAILGMPQPMNIQAQLLQWTIKVIGLLATVAIAVYIPRLAKTTLGPSPSARDL